MNEISLQHGIQWRKYKWSREIELRHSSRRLLLMSLGISLACAFGQPMAQQRSVIDENGMVNVPAFGLPLSGYMSEESKRAFIERALHPPPIEYAESGEKVRRFRETIDRYIFTPFLARARARYPVLIARQSFAGVRVDVVTPREGVAIGNENRVLINLHGGGFLVGAGLGGLVESVPIVGVGKIKVISVDYRQGPEHEFPAASEDVAAVYGALLKKYKASSIGIYGCSAGGQLAAMSMAWFQRQGLPKPGAIGIFCSGAAAVFGGDSYHTVPALVGEPPAPSRKAGDATEQPYGISRAYFGSADLSDPLLSPVVSPAVLAKFPPTLFITGTRDDSLSTAAYAHTQLVKAGATADLHVWDGMWHAFLYDVDLPESREAFEVAVDFFREHLH